MAIENSSQSDQLSEEALAAAIVARLPYGPGFHFVDRLRKLGPESIEGEYTFKADSAFYADHFPGFPLTPGVILTECMAQIGLVCFGLYLHWQTHQNWPEKGVVAFTDSEVKFIDMVKPGETVVVKAAKKYFRLGKLKVEVRMEKPDGSTICRGQLAGIWRTAL